MAARQELSVFAVVKAMFVVIIVSEATASMKVTIAAVELCTTIRCRY